MKTTQLNFDNFAQDAQKYINELAGTFGHPDENKRSLILWRSVMHTIRDRIHFGEALDIMGPLPIILKGIYVENWKFSEKPLLSFNTMEEMKDEVKRQQSGYGEEDFDWSKSTEELIGIVLKSLNEYMPPEQLEHILGQLPKEVKGTLEEKIS